MSGNYIDAVLSGDDRDEIIELFYLDPVAKESVDRYAAERLSVVALKLFDILADTPTNRIIDVIEAHKEKIPDLTTRDIPMFSDLKAVDMVPGVAQANPGATFPEIGAILLPNNRTLNQRKWGETHYRLAAMMRLVENGTNAEVTFLGREYAKLARPGSGEESTRMRNMLRPRLCLCSPCIQYLVVKSRRDRFNAMELYRRYLTESNVKYELDIHESSNWRMELERELRKVAIGRYGHLIIYVTHDIVCSEDFRSKLLQFGTRIKRMLVGDEVHGLGAPQMQKGLPTSRT